MVRFSRGSFRTQAVIKHKGKLKFKKTGLNLINSTLYVYSNLFYVLFVSFYYIKIKKNLKTCTFIKNFIIFYFILYFSRLN